MNEIKFTVRRTGNVGLEIVSPNGVVMAWTTDEVIGAVLCDLLNTNQKAASIIEAATHN
jgi:hypothetical protein